MIDVVYKPINLAMLPLIIVLAFVPGPTFRLALIPYSERLIILYKDDILCETKF